MWFDFISCQSGHGVGINQLKWHVFGPPATQWNKPPTKPVIDLEPKYESPAQAKDAPAPEYLVRRAVYRSCLLAPTCGVTYGTGPIWVWNEQPAPAERHGNRKVARWDAGLDSAAVHNMTLLRRFFESGLWYRRWPVSDLLASQPAAADPAQVVSAACTDDAMWAVVYKPVGGAITLKMDRFKASVLTRWVDPRTGEFRDAGPVDKAEFKATAPDAQDWILEVRANTATRCLAEYRDEPMVFHRK